MTTCPHCGDISECQECSQAGDGDNANSRVKCDGKGSYSDSAQRIRWSETLLEGLVHHSEDDFDDDFDDDFPDEPTDFETED